MSSNLIFIMIDLILISIIGFGLINSYTDLKYGKIKNASIILMILIAIVLNTYLHLFTYETIINSLIAIIFGFTVYFLNYWSAGDAKLFFAFTLLFPISFYHFGKINYFPAIAILINTFVPVAIFYFFRSIRTIKYKKFLQNLKFQFNKIDFFTSIVYLFGFPFIYMYFHLKLDVFTSTIIVLILFQLLKKVPKKYGMFLFSLLSVLNILFLLSNNAILNFFYSFIFSILIYQIFKVAYILLTSISFSTPVDIKKLKPGQIVGQPLFFLDGTFFKVTKKGGQKIHTLTNNQVAILKKLYASGKIKFKTLLIEQTVPFAPFIFLGVLITYLIGGNLFSFVYLKYIKYFISQFSL